MTTRRRELREEASYSESVKKLGGAENADEALEAILEALTLRPEGFDVVPGWEPIRLAKTIAAVQGGSEIPALRLWFRIVDETTVSLLHIETIPDGDS